MTAIYSLLATSLVVFHALWILWVVLGPFVVRQRRGLRLLQLGCVAATLLVQARSGWCPFTGWEQSLQQMAGRSGYSGGFIEHYASMFVYGDLVTFSPAAMVVGLCTIAAGSLWVYLFPVIASPRTGES